jgi:hypothetical protein
MAVMYTAYSALAYLSRREHSWAVGGWLKIHEYADASSGCSVICAVSTNPIVNAVCGWVGGEGGGYSAGVAVSRAIGIIGAEREEASVVPLLANDEGDLQTKHDLFTN